MNPAGPIVVLADQPQHPLFSSWLPLPGRPVMGLTKAGIDQAFPEGTALVVTADCYHEPRVTLLRRAIEQNIPTLVLADGILEFRNTWEHPQLPPGSLFQPVLGHKLACIGRSQARVLESWHNGGRCEVTGSPRFDRLLGQRRRERPADAPVRVLVMTALTPYFTEEHHRQVRQSLLDLKAAFNRRTPQGGPRLEPVWRLTKGLDAEIDVDPTKSEWHGRDLGEVLRHMDAVITTPSTSMLEAMLLGLPVALLDYCNVPHYVPAAWRITAPNHLAPTLAELADPPAPKMLYQDSVLHDALECLTPAAPRLRALAEAMILAGDEAQRLGRPLVLPDRIIAYDAVAPAEERFRLDELYPGHPQFGAADLRALQVEVGHLRQHTADVERRAAAVCQLNAQHAQLTIAWRSKLEAAQVVAALGLEEPARRLLLDGVNAVKSCQAPPVVLDALLGLCPALAPLDPGRARYLLGMAVKLATTLKNSPARERAEQLLAEMDRVAVPA